MTRKEILQWIAEGAALPGEPIPGQSLIEISGQHRVLIENHLGIQEYTRERISVKLKKGSIHICGSGLELSRMNQEQVIIRGEINTISIKKGCR